MPLQFLKRNPNHEIKQLTKDLTVGKPSKNILMFVVPVIIGHFFQLLYNWTDAIIIGQFMGPNAFGALSACSPVINLFITLTLGFMTGAAVVLGQLFGNKSYEDMRKAQTTIITCMLIASAILMLAGALLARPLLNLLNVSPDQIDMSVSYLRIYFLGIAAMAMFNTFAQMIQSVGNSIIPLLALIAGTVANIVLDLLFIAVFNMGIAGAAIATVIGQALAALICFLYVQKRISILRIKRREFRFDIPLFGRTIRLAVPSMIQQLCASLGFLVINALINKNGPDFTTAFGLGNRIDELMTIQIMSFGTALTAFSAQNKGVGNIDRIKKGLRSSLLMCAGLIAFFGALLLIFRHNLISVFMSVETDLGGNPEVVSEITAKFMAIMIPSFFALEAMFLLSAVLRGTGAAIAAMEVNLVSLIFRVAAALLLNRYFGYIGVFIATPIGWFIGMLWAILHYFRKKWACINNVVPNPETVAATAEANENK